MLGSGNLGLVYLLEEPRRLTLEEIEERHPQLISALREHPHVGFLLVRSSEHGPVVARRARRPLPRRTAGSRARTRSRRFSPHARHHLRRTDGFPHVADIMVNSFYDPQMDEGCAFEELISFHGGLGGGQTRPFILHPVSLALPDEPIVGAAAVHGRAERVARGAAERRRGAGPPRPSRWPRASSVESLRTAIVIPGSEVRRRGGYRISPVCRRQVAAAGRLAAERRVEAVVFTGCSRGSGPSEAEQMRDAWDGPGRRARRRADGAHDGGERGAHAAAAPSSAGSSARSWSRAPLHVFRSRFFFPRRVRRGRHRDRAPRGRAVPSPRAVVWELGAAPLVRRQLRAVQAELARTEGA